MSIITAIVLNLAVYSNTLFPPPLMLWPPFAYYRAISLLSKRGYFFADISSSDEVCLHVDSVQKTCTHLRACLLHTLVHLHTHIYSYTYTYTSTFTCTRTNTNTNTNSTNSTYNTYNTYNTHTRSHVHSW
jgi:hypothetical protein